MKKKYQIFISSTYEDLKEERDLVIKAILEMGHFPVGMEMFSAGDEEQWEIIRKQIEECDYYVVITAFCYGSMDGAISYTEKEYDFATNIGVPTLGFIAKNNANWPQSKVDKDPNKIEKLNIFKEKIKKKYVSYWEDKNDLHGKVAISLMKQFNTNERAGWVKSSDFNTPEVLSEVSRLSKENSALRAQIEELKAVHKLDEEEKISFTRLLHTLKHNERKIAFRYKHTLSYKTISHWEDETSISLGDVFILLGPQLMIENSIKHCAYYIGMMKRPQKDRDIIPKAAGWATPSNTIKSIMVDLNTLDLVEPSTKKHSIKDENEYWSLTIEGKKRLKQIRRVILDNNLETIESIYDAILRQEDEAHEIQPKSKQLPNKNTVPSS